jgi:hypothetical protein
MDTGLVTMNPMELMRAACMQRISERRTTQAEAAGELGLSLRQVERLYAAYKLAGAKALANKRRGCASNRRLSEAYQQAVLEAVRKDFADFGPTLAHEKLTERKQAVPSVETLRKWMSADGLWRTRKERRKRAQSPRSRRDCVGELIQIDGSDHAWFEERGPACTLLVYVDDATSKLMELRFVRSESTFDYFASTESYLRRYGKPVAFYSDKAAVFRVNAKEAVGGVGYTQFGRAMLDLNIDIICANTPAAKGRVERANQTLQDRLVKELRLRDISDRDAGNAFLEEFREGYNGRFARQPKNLRDAHREPGTHEDLRRVLCVQEQRRLSNNLVLHYKRVLYVITSTPASENARGKRVAIRENEDGSIHIEHCGVELLATPFEKDAHVLPGAIVDNKHLGHALRLIQEAQHERDVQRLDSKKLTLREKDRLREAMAQTQSDAPEPTPNKRKPRAAPTYPPMPLAAHPTPDPDPLAGVLAWAKRQTPEGESTRSEHPRRVAPKRPAARLK